MTNLLKQLVNKILADGNRVFLSDNGEGTSGFFCNPEGTLVCSFWSGPWCGYNIASQYVSKKPLKEGQGYLLIENCTDFRKVDTSKLLRLNNSSKTHRPKTLEEYLQQYQWSSFKEVFKDDTEIAKHR